MMPSLEPTVFNITQNFHCTICNTEWNPAVKIFYKGRVKNETVEMALKKALHAGNSVLFGYLGIDDLIVDRQLLSRIMGPTMGELKIHCKNGSANRTCWDCLYPSLERRNSGDDKERLTIIEIESEWPTPPHTINYRSSARISPLSKPLVVSPLSENPPDHQPQEDPSYYPPSSQLNPPSTLPTPAPRSRNNQTLSAPCADSLAADTMLQGAVGTTYVSHRPALHTGEDDLHAAVDCTDDDDAYTIPIQLPPLPPKPSNNWDPLQNLFPCSEVVVRQIRDALQQAKINGLYALVKSPQATGGQKRTPYIIFCEQLKDKYKCKTVFEEDIGSGSRWFIHKNVKFDSLNSLLLHYKKSISDCDTYLSIQLTHEDLHRMTAIYSKTL